MKMYRELMKVDKIPRVLTPLAVKPVRKFQVSSALIPF